ncbi:MAG: Jag N-terminal domain-containing protein [Desulfocapsaceae bacterium]
MSADRKDFYGKDVAEAIREACETLETPQEQLDIEVIETGTKGIFGLIRQKAHIRVRIQQAGKQNEEQDAAPQQPPSTESPAPKPKKKPRPARPARKKSLPAETEKPQTVVEKPLEEPVEELAQPTAEEPRAERPEAEPVSIDTNDSDDDSPAAAADAQAAELVELSAESLAIIKDDLKTILELMGCMSTVTVEDVDGTAHCRVSAEHEETLTSQDGRVLDSLQYLLRKIVAKKISGRIQLTIDVGDYRERRYQELREQAAEYAGLVKENGKTQVISSLNPSERRVVHVALQDDPDIRSRSIGDGLFKKVLIYKPGKGRKNSNRKRGRSKSRKKGGTGPKQES